MAQYDILLYQNVSPSTVLFKEQFVNIAKGCILSADSSGVPTVLAAGTDGYFLKRNNSTATGLEWVAPSTLSIDAETNATSLTTRIGLLTGAAEDESAARYNVLVGYNTGNDITTGYENTFVGAKVGELITTSRSNTFIGYNTGRIATDAYACTIIGCSAGYSLTTGGQNIIIGENAGATIATGAYNIVIGCAASYAPSNAERRLYIGYSSATSDATEKDAVIIYGDINASAPSSQNLRFNAKIYATQLSNASTSYVVYYNTSTKELSYSTFSTFSYPSSGIVSSTGSAWGTSYSSTGSGTVIVLQTDPQLLGIPSIRNAAGTSSLVGYFSSSSQRWGMGKTSEAESTGNAGSNFAIYSYTDAGAYLATPFTINRATGGASFYTYLGVGGSYDSNYALTVTGTISTTSILGGSSVDVFNTVSTTVNAFGAATTLTIGCTETATSTTNISTGNVAGGNSKTINIGTGGQASSTTHINIGCQTSSVQPGTLTFGGFDTIVHSSNRTSLTLFNANTTTLTMAGAAETINISSAAMTATQTINIGSGCTRTQTINLGTGSVASGYYHTLNFATNAQSGSTCYVYFGSSSTSLGMTVRGWFLAQRTDGYSGHFDYTGTTAAQHVVLIRHGATSGTTVHILQAQDGNLNNRGYINMNISTSVLTFVSGSDERLKTNISKTKMDALNIVNNIPVKDFNFKEKPKDPLITGFMAQDVDKYFPEAVSYDKENDKWDLAWGYSMNPLYHKAIQELTDKIKQLETEIQTLKS